MYSSYLLLLSDLNKERRQILHEIVQQTILREFQFLLKIIIFAQFGNDGSPEGSIFET